MINTRVLAASLELFLRRSSILVQPASSRRKHRTLLTVDATADTCKPLARFFTDEFHRVDLQDFSESHIQSAIHTRPIGRSAETFPDSSIGRASGC